MNQRPPQVPGSAAGRFLGAVFGLIFFGIGVTVLVFVWSERDTFGGPPVFFKVFASFIALAFVAMGGTLAVSSILGSGLGAQTPDLADPPDPSRSAASPPPKLAGQYLCPNCGATLTSNSDVSPLGDVKCPFCGSWFNIHGRTT